MTPSTDEILDVAVVGGGVSGVYSAWRLLNDNPGTGPKLKVAVFEGSKRIGGRLLSLVPPGMPHLIAELGGQNYFSSQNLVRSLVENKLCLPYVALPMDSTSVAPSKKSVVYLRGKHLRWGELNDPDKIPYHLDWSEYGRGADGLMNHALEQLVPGVTRLNGPALEALLRTARVEGRHLFDWGYWNLIKQAMSQEAYEFTRDSGGYDFLLLNYNAADMILMSQGLDPNTTYNIITTGYEQLPLTLYHQFQEAGGRVYLQNRLKSFDTTTLPDGTTGVKIVVYANSQGWGPDAGGDPVTVTARSLILALPRHSLELLDQTGALFNDPDRAQRQRVQTLLTSVTALPFFTLYLCYRNPWWETLGVKAGKAVTDLPMRQCFYSGVEGDQKGADPRNRNSLLTATFSDMLNVDYWAGLRNEQVLPPFPAQPNPYLKSSPGSPHWPEYRAQVTGAMVNDIQRQLMEVHDLRFVPPPYDAAFMDWGDDPFGGAAHLWNIHARSWDLMPQIAQPLPHAPIYICGEAYSRQQGYVEGALESAELVLQHHFHLPPPDWLIKKEQTPVTLPISIKESTMVNDESNIPASDDPQETPGQDQTPVSGVALRAADGSLYFIPDRALETFRVTNTIGRSALQDKLAAGAQTDSLQATHVELPGAWFKNVNILR